MCEMGDGGVVEGWCERRCMGCKYRLFLSDLLLISIFWYRTSSKLISRSKRKKSWTSKILFIVIFSRLIGFWRKGSDNGPSRNRVSRRIRRTVWIWYGGELGAVVYLGTRLDQKWIWWKSWKAVSRGLRGGRGISCCEQAKLLSPDDLMRVRLLKCTFHIQSGPLTDSCQWQGQHKDTICTFWWQTAARRCEIQNGICCNAESSVIESIKLINTLIYVEREN